MAFEHMYDDLAVVDLETGSSPTVRRLTYNAGWYDARWKDEEDIIVATRYPAGLNLEPENAGEWTLTPPLFRPERPAREPRPASGRRYAVSRDKKLVQMPGAREVRGIGSEFLPFLNHRSMYATEGVSYLVQLHQAEKRRTWCQISNSPLASTESYSVVGFIIDDDTRKILWSKTFTWTPFVRRWFGEDLIFWHIELDKREVWKLNLRSGDIVQVGSLPGAYNDSDWHPATLNLEQGAQQAQDRS